MSNPDLYSPQWPGRWLVGVPAVQHLMQVYQLAEAELLRHSSWHFTSRRAPVDRTCEKVAGAPNLPGQPYALPRQSDTAAHRRDTGRPLSRPRTATFSDRSCFDGDIHEGNHVDPVCHED